MSGSMSVQEALPEGEVVFAASGVERAYPGVKALEGVDLTGYAGEVLAICGEAVDMATVSGVYRLARVQPAGRRPMTAAAYLRGRRAQPALG